MIRQCAAGGSRKVDLAAPTSIGLGLEERKRSQFGRWACDAGGLVVRAGGAKEAVS